MVCSKCATKNAKGNAFCVKCGSPLSSEESNNSQVKPEVQGEGTSQEGSSNQANGATPQIKPMNKKANNKLIGIIIAAVAAVLLIIVVAVIAISQPKKVNVGDFVKIYYYGYDGYGTASAYFDEDAYYKVILEAKGKSKDKSDPIGYLEDVWDFSNAVYSIKLDISPRENLSNGDEVKVDISYDNEKAKEHKIKFVGKSITGKVEGLEEVVKIDPFANLKVSFDGISPDGSLDYEYLGDDGYVKEYNFDPDKKYGLRNGEKVTFSIDQSDEDTLRRGYALTVKEKEYIVEGLEEYGESYSDLSTEFLDKAKKEAEDTIYSYTASYSNNTSLGELTYAGYIYNTVKADVKNHNNYNNLYLIYSGTVSNADGKFRASKVYFPVRFTDITKNGDNFSYSEIRGIVGSTYFDGSWDRTDGYTNPLTCYMEIVEANREKYEAESGDGFEKFGQYENISSLSDISDDYKNKLHSEAKDAIESYVAGSYNEASHLSDLTLKGEYLLISKNQGTDFKNNNRYIVVYSGKATNDAGSFNETTVYFPIAYDGIVSLPDDEYMFTSYGGIMGSTYFDNSWYKTNGYIDGEEMFRKLITANRDAYTYEISEGLKEFGE